MAERQRTPAKTPLQLVKFLLSVPQFKPHMDGCLRNGNWLNITTPWDSDVDELLPCDQDVKPGSYFPGLGLALFKTSGDMDVALLFMFTDHKWSQIPLQRRFCCFF